ncbi:ABC transporter substrate-binding protein [Mesorhizobium sp.]|uniref:ABC transporter substrate-binding protein n=1 Tax=Mesorhizobium sp. TaxID=1871066 RepID=UPI000FEAB472|nr:ABC transporter substrate-binding protein [Mesorhizobium sp.]RWJ05742.1 MAG: ABC transporter substrate-binding protein [Mesorhizobium sp.]
MRWNAKTGFAGFAGHAKSLAIAAALAMTLTTTAQAETVLKIRPQSDLRVLDPITTSAHETRNHGYLIYDTLFASDSKGAIQPQMVDSYTVSEDGLTWKFTLRDGLKFHDDTPVTSEDVIASLKRWGERDNFGQQLMSRAVSLTADDAKTFTLVLKEGWALVLEALGKPSTLVPFIMPARIAATPSTEAISDPIGSGPFMMVREEWVPGAKVVYKKAPTYVPRKEAPDGLSGAKIANVDRIEWHIIADHQAALNALQAGEIDIYEEIPAELIPVVKENQNVAIERLNRAQVMLRMNQLQPPFDNQKLRQALLYLFDPMQILPAYTDDDSFYRACPSFYMCDSPFFTDVEWPKPDSEKAKQLIKESSYNGETIALMDPIDVAVSPLAKIVSQMMSDAGLNVDHQGQDWASIVQRRSSKKPVSEGGWSAWVGNPGAFDMWDPATHLGLRSNGEAGWFGWPKDDEIENLRAEFTKELDLEKRKEIARQIQLRALETVPYIPIGEFDLLRAINKELQGVIVYDVPVYWNISK